MVIVYKETRVRVTFKEDDEESLNLAGLLIEAKMLFTHAFRDDLHVFEIKATLKWFESWVNAEYPGREPIKAFNVEEITCQLIRQS